MNDNTAWQTILWREWRNSHDEEYARHIYSLIADVPAHPLSFGMILLFDVITGAAIGIISGLVMTSQGSIIQQLMLAGAVLGLIHSCATGWRLSWRAYLTRLGSSLPVGRPQDWLVGAVLLMAGGSFIFSPGFPLVLIGLFWGMGGLIGWLNSGVKPPTDEYTYRVWYFWWRGAPSFDTFETALHQGCEQNPSAYRIWSEPLQRLAKPPNPAIPVNVWLEQLSHEDWVERLVARHNLIVLGDEAIRPLQRIALDEENPLHPTAQWLLNVIRQM